MKLSIIIPACNEEAYVGACLESILGAVSGKSYPIEVIVVNNASTDATASVALSFPGVRVVDEPSKGLTKARQRGLEEARGEFLAYLDADTRISARWFSIIERKLFTQPDVACYSGPYHYYDGSLILRFFLGAVWWLSAPLTYRLVGYMVLGGNFVARKEALLAMGGFDSTIQFYGEDTDIARRISRYGRAVFDMDFFVLSSSRRFQKQGFFKITWTYGVNFIWQIIFHRPYHTHTSYE